MENNEIWQQNGTWQIKLNSLFLFVDDKEIPAHFWLLSQLVEISQLDSDEEEFLLELVFDAELVIFRFETQEILEEWKSRLDEAKNFDPSKFFSGENVTDVKEIFVALDNSNLLIFNMDLKWRTFNKNCYLLTSVNDLKVKDSKPEVSLVKNLKKLFNCSSQLFSFQVRKTELWRLSFGNYGECNEFITKFKRLWKKK